jgi:hypothetical protein
MHHARAAAAAQPLPLAAGAAPRLGSRRCTPTMEPVRGAAIRSGMVLSCVMPVSVEPSNKGMKQTSVEHTERSQLIPSVGQTVAS